MIKKSRFQDQIEHLNLCDKYKNISAHSVYWDPNYSKIEYEIKNAIKNKAERILSDILPHELPVSVDKTEYDFFCEKFELILPAIPKYILKERNHIILYDGYSLQSECIPKYIEVLSNNKIAKLITLNKNFCNIKDILLDIMNADSILIESRCPTVNLIVNYLSDKFEITLYQKYEDINYKLRYLMLDSRESVHKKTLRQDISIREKINHFTKAKSQNSEKDTNVLDNLKFNKIFFNDLHNVKLNSQRLLNDDRVYLNETYENNYFIDYYYNLKTHGSKFKKELDYYVLENFIHKSLSSNAWFGTYKELKKEIRETDIILESIIQDIYNKDSESKELFLKLGISIVANNDFANVGEKLKILGKFLNLDLRFRNTPKSNEIHKLLLNIINYYETNSSFPIDELDIGLMSFHVIKDAIPLIYTIFGNDFSLRFIDYIYNDKRYNKVIGLYEKIVLAKFQHLNYNIWDTIKQGSDKILHKEDVKMLIDLESRRTEISSIIQIVTNTFNGNDPYSQTNSFKLLQIRILLYTNDLAKIKDIFKKLDLTVLSSKQFFLLLTILVCLKLDDEIQSLLNFDNLNVDFYKTSKFKSMFLIFFDKFVKNIGYDVNSFISNYYNYYSLYKEFLDIDLLLEQNTLDKIINFQKNKC